VTVWERIALLTARRARATLALVAVATLFFASFLGGIRIDTSFRSFVRPEARALVSRIEDDFDEGAYLTLIFESRGGRSLLEPELLHQQLRIIREVEKSHPVTSFSLVQGIDRGLQRVKHEGLFEVDDYSTIAEAILGLAGGRTVRDLMKVSTHFLSHPQAIEFYANLRIAQQAGAVPAPGAPDSHYRTPYVKAIRALIRTEGEATGAARRAAMVAIRKRVASLATPEIALHVLSDDLVAYDIDQDTRRSAVLLGAMVFLVDALCVAALFRSGGEVAIVFAILSVSSIWTFGLAALLGIDLSFLHILAFPILLGTGIDDTLVFGRRFREEARPDRGFEETLRATYAGCGNAVFLTTFTTLVAFLVTGLTAVADVFASFFLLVAASMAIVLGVTLLLEGSLRSEAARHGWRLGQGAASRPALLDACNARLVKLSLRVLHRGSRPVLAVGGVALALALLSATRLDSQMTRSDLLQPGIPSWRANQAMQTWFGDFRVGYVLFSGDVAQADLLVKMKQLERRLDHCDVIEKVLGTANVDSVVGLLEKLGIRITPGMDVGAALDRLRRSDRTADWAIDMSFREASDYAVHRGPGGYDGLLTRFFVDGEEGSRSIAAAETIGRDVHDLGLDAVPGVETRIGGGDIVYPLESVYYARTLARSFVLSLLANGLVLWVAWRRAGRAALALLPVSVAAILVVGALPLFGVSLNALNLGISAILVGIGIDYPIHWIERYDEERLARRRGSGAAARLALETMGPHLLAGMLTTAVGFAASTVLLLPMSTSFGLTMGAAIFLVYALTLLGLPALIAGSARGPGPDREAGLEVAADPERSPRMG
jgi:predicted RND superfamily exporter protein